MILVDFSSAMISRIVHGKSVINEQSIRSMCLDRVLSIKKQFGSKYGELVICKDTSNYWRKEFFPFYKAKRTDFFEKSKFDWSMIMNGIHSFADDLEVYFPYRVIKVPRTEADDIIGVLTKEYHSREKILIYSADSDFNQLLKYPGVDQYSPVTKKLFKVSNPEMYLKEKIIRGDKGDGIPNILSSDNTFVTPGARQPPIRKTKLNTWLGEEPSVFCENENILRNWHRNRTLIDLENTPQDIQDEIRKQFLEHDSSDWRRDNVISYLSKNGMGAFLTNLQDF